jgi:hypothetical protein
MHERSTVVETRHGESMDVGRTGHASWVVAAHGERVG